MWAIAKQKLNQDRKLPVWQRLMVLSMAIVLMFCLSACGGGDRPAASKVNKKIETASISEVSPPLEIQRLNQALDKYEPQLTIVSPKSDAIIQDNRVTIQLSVTDLPVFKSPLGLGPHVHVTLDGQEYQPLYDLSQSIVFDNLTPGTHTIRAFASRPWHESFKNEGAYAQATFHVYAKTGENTPNPQLPLLTYSRPVGVYGTEPILLDFYLRNAPLHIAALEDSDLSDWQIRATINGQSFLTENWQPLYLKGFKPGKNWVRLEFLDRDGKLIANQFNSTVHLIDYQPGGQDTLSRLMRGEKIADVDKIVDPNYVAPSEPTGSPTELKPAAPVVTPTPQPTPSVTTAPAIPETAKPQPVVVPVVPVVPVPAPVPITKSEPSQIVPTPIKQPEATQTEKPAAVTPVTPPAKVKPEKAGEKSDRPSFQQMFDRFKEKVTPKPAAPKLEKAAPKPVTTILTAPTISPEATVPKPEVKQPVPAQPKTKVEEKAVPKPVPTIAPAPTTSPEATVPKPEVKRPATAQPKAKVDEKSERPGWQQMFQQFKAKITPIPSAPGRVKPIVEKVTPQPSTTISPAPTSTPEIKQPVPAQPKAKVEEKSQRPEWQQMFQQFKEKVTPKPAPPKVVPKQLDKPVPKPVEMPSTLQVEQATPAKPVVKIAPPAKPVETIPQSKPTTNQTIEQAEKSQQPATTSVPQNQAPEAARSPTWQERLRQQRQSEVGSSGKDNSLPKSPGAIPIPEAL